MEEAGHGPLDGPQMMKQDREEMIVLGGVFYIKSEQGLEDAIFSLISTRCQRQYLPG